MKEYSTAHIGKTASDTSSSEEKPTKIYQCNSDYKMPVPISWILFRYTHYDDVFRKKNYDDVYKDLYTTYTYSDLNCFKIARILKNLRKLANQFSKSNYLHE